MGFLSFLVRLDGDNRGFKNMIDDSKKMTDSWAEKAKSKTSEWISSLGSAATGLKLLHGTFRELNAEMEKAKDIKFGSERLGIDWQHFQTLTIEAEKSRNSIEEVTTATEKLGKAQAMILSKSNEGGAGMGGELGKYAEILGLKKDDLTKDPLKNLEGMRTRFAGRSMTTEQRVAAKKLTGNANIVSFLTGTTTASDYFGMKSDDEIAAALVAGQDKSARKQFYHQGISKTLSSTGAADVHVGDAFGHFMGNAARWATGTQWKDLKSFEESIAAAKAKAAKAAADQGNEFSKLLEIEHREADEAERTKRVKEEQLALDKELLRNAELRDNVKLSGMDKNQQRNYLMQQYGEYSQSAAQFRSLGSDPKMQEMALQMENKALEFEAKLKAVARNTVPGYSDSNTRSGIYIGSRVDRLIDVNRAQLKELQAIRRVMESKKGGFIGDVRTLPDSAFNV